MSQFRPLSLERKQQTSVLTEEQRVSNTPSPATSPLFSSAPAPATGQLNTISAQPPSTAITTGQLSRLPAILTTEQLSVLPASLAAPSTSERILRIPGTQKKRIQTTDTLPHTSRRMSKRLRHGIVLFAICFVAMFSLLSLAPLANGQNALPIVTGFTDWVRTEQSSWQLQAHLAPINPPTSADSTQSQSQPVATPPPMILPTSVYIAIAQQDALNAGIPPDYFVRQINQESGFNPNAYSPAGAEGIAQFMPGTAAGLGINPWDPKQALNAAAHVMAGYAHSYGGDYAKALAAYNGGSGTVQYAVNACGASNWMNCLPGETRNYIYVIMGQ